MPDILDCGAGGMFVRADYPDYEEEFDLDCRYEISESLRVGTRKIVASEALPETLVLRTRKKSLPDSFMTLNGMKVFSARAITIIEELDPGVHQFFPIKIIYKNGESFHLQGYKIGHFFTKKKSLDVSRPSIGRYANGALHTVLIRDYPIYFHATSLAGPNLWREEGFKDGLFSSDILQARMKSEKLRFFKPERKSVVLEQTP